MQLTLAVVALQSLRHRRHQKPPPSKTEDGAPQRHFSARRVSLSVVFYSSHVAVRKKERNPQPGHPSRGEGFIERLLLEQVFKGLACALNVRRWHQEAGKPRPGAGGGGCGRDIFAWS